MNLAAKLPVSSAAPDVEAVFAAWVARLGQCLVSGDTKGAASLFAPDGYWKDILAFTWQHKFFAGPDEIERAFAATVPTTAPTKFAVASARPAAVATRRSHQDVIEGYFDFETKVGRGTGFARLLRSEEDPWAPTARIVLTTLQELRGFEEKVGARRPTGDEYAMNVHGCSWREDRDHRRKFEDRDPEVIVIGAGHAGLVAAARLRQLGVDTLVVEKSARIGDVWRERYDSLTLHNEIMANHLPYMPFPSTWPIWLSKDHMALWLEVYAQCMELDVWTSTELVCAERDEKGCDWNARLRREDGTVVDKRCRHIVVAAGVSGSIPHKPEIAGLSTFQGEVVHSSEFKGGAGYRGKNAIVVGTGNSAHDIAQDLHVKGAASVSMLQRGPTCVISLQPGAAMIYKIYDDERPTEDVDLIAAAIPYPLLEESYRWITKKAARLDAELLDALAARGFKTHFGSDGTGFQMMYMRGEGGYYIDVGCSAFISDGSIPVLQTDDMTGFVADGLEMTSGEVVPADVVVLATGFQNMQENVRRMFGDQVAEKVGKVWGFDEDYQMRAMWRRTGQEGLWITGGALLDSRLFSRFMTLEIKADLEGILPARAELPFVRGAA